MIRDTHVPDKLEGYLLQVRHALYELISTDERIVSIEAYDDVAVEKKDVLVAEQLKSVLSNNNPVSDRAEAFWKTIYNWCRYLQEELPQKEIVLKYVIVSTHDIRVGKIPEQFAKATTDDAAKCALEDARKELIGDESTDEGKTLVGQTIRPYIDFCFAPENEAVFIKVITLMDIDIHEDTYDENLLTKFKMQPIPMEYEMELFYSMLGWVQEQTHQQTKKNQAAFISSSDYRKALELQIRSTDRKLIWRAVSLPPENKKVTEEIEQHDTYIKQLELIDVDATDIFEAVSDFIRTKTEKTAWAEKGLVYETSFDDYLDGLRKLWRSQKIYSSAIPVDDVSKGKITYAQCLKDVHTHHLFGSEVPAFFGNGSLHSLANEPSQNPEIGWHPRYLELLIREDTHNDE